MARHNIHHMPVMDGTRIVGMITATDLAEQHSTSPVYLAGDVYKQTTVEGLARTSTKIRPLQQHLAAADASAYSTGHIITTITDALTTRLLHLAASPIGSTARGLCVGGGRIAGAQRADGQVRPGQLPGAGRPLRRGTRTATTFAPCRALSVTGWPHCGYIHCPGEMMAMTDKWRQPRARWAAVFPPVGRQARTHGTDADLRLLRSARHPRQRRSCSTRLRQEVLQRTRGNSLFLAHMVGNALKHRPPLGLFGTISRIRGGENAGTIDLKHSGIVPIVDLARVYALAGGVAAVNTHDRLEQAARRRRGQPAKCARDLRDALEFLSQTAHRPPGTRRSPRGRSPTTSWHSKNCPTSSAATSRKPSRWCKRCRGCWGSGIRRGGIESFWALALIG